MKLSDGSQFIKLLPALLCGVFLEYFDFTLYGFSAPAITHLFFPKQMAWSAALLTWAIFALSFLVRPFGAVFIGHFADRFGRRNAALFSVLAMSFATLGLGLLPTYAVLGIFAPILLILCRIIQGLAVSTEYSGSNVYLMEFKNSRRGLISGVTTSASGFGIFAASLLVLLLHDFNWRLPFIIAGCLVGILGFYLRLGLAETPEFLSIETEHKIEPFPLLALLKKMPRLLFKMTLISAFAGIVITVLEVYLPSYLQAHYFLARNLALKISTYLALIEAIFAILCGWLSDYIGQARMIRLSLFLTIVGIFPGMYLFTSKATAIYYVAATFLAFIIAMIDGPIAAYLVNHFPSSVRYSGVSLSYSLGAALIGGFSPAILIILQQHLFYEASVQWYLVISALFTLFAWRILKKQ